MKPTVGSDQSDRAHPSVLRHRQCIANFEFATPSPELRQSQSRAFLCLLHHQSWTVQFRFIDKATSSSRKSSTMTRIGKALILYIALLFLSLAGTRCEENIDDDVEGDDGTVGNQIQVCADAVIEVQDASILCDSPGTFYYGSGKYRNSASCQPGDKAKIKIDFYIADAGTIAQAGGYAIVDVNVEQSGWFTSSKTIYENANLCSLSTLSSSSGSSCPYAGYYSIETQFYWESSDSNSGSSFVPTLVAGFKSSVNQNTYDYGGVNTNNCRGGSLPTWVDGANTSYADALSNFMKTFGILGLTIFVMAFFIWFLAKKPRSFSDARAKLGFSDKREKPVDEEFDFKKIQQNDNDLVDF